MSSTSLESLKIRAKLFQKAKKKSGQLLTLKEALAVIAKNSGYSTWKQLKDSYEEGDLFNPPHWSAQWKNWFASSEEAKQVLKQEGELYLLPYRRQCFLCDKNYLNALGIEENDPDLLLVGRNWLAPQNALAWQRLRQKIKNFQQRPLDKDLV